MTETAGGDVAPGASVCVIALRGSALAASANPVPFSKPRRVTLVELFCSECCGCRFAIFCVSKCWEGWELFGLLYLVSIDLTPRSSLRGYCNEVPLDGIHQDCILSQRTRGHLRQSVKFVGVLLLDYRNRATAASRSGIDALSRGVEDQLIDILFDRNSFDFLARIRVEHNHRATPAADEQAMVTLIKRHGHIHLATRDRPTRHHGTLLTIEHLNLILCALVDVDPRTGPRHCHRLKRLPINLDVGNLLP